ncbi:hypothetical protein F5Y19DRAFT_493107 [Xylariaceae sp. FL1651]|nr:hypothetical protein F5Y19DRAFT_493107 [Xylariaceae sp. FL1651]
MEVIGAIASFIAIGQAIGAVPKIANTLRSFTKASNELAALVEELDCLVLFNQYTKENISLFSGEHNSSHLKVKEPPYLEQARIRIESLIRELQRLAESCTSDRVHLKAARIRWWRKKDEIARLQAECCKQRQQLEYLYRLFKDQADHKRGNLLVHIHAQLSQNTGISHREIVPLESWERDPLPAVPGPIEQSPTITMDSKCLPDTAMRAEGAFRFRCRCTCHSHQQSIQTQSLYIKLSNTGYLSYRRRRILDNDCKLRCCANSKGSITLRFQLPKWLCYPTISGSFSLEFPFTLYMSITPTTFRHDSSSLTLRRICLSQKPELFLEWLSNEAGSILSVDSWGDSALMDLSNASAFSLLSYCATQWPKLIQGTEAGRAALFEARKRLLLSISNTENELSESERVHLISYIHCVEDGDDDEDGIIKIMSSADPIKQLDLKLSDTPDIFTRTVMDGQTLLHLACLIDRVDLVDYIIDHGASLDIADSSGNTPLYIAINRRSWASAKLLIDKGCQINIVNRWGLTPLMITVNSISGHDREAHLAKVLLSKGALATFRDGRGECVWHKISSFAAKVDWGRELYQLIFDAGGAELIDARNARRITPLMKAIPYCDLPLISFLQRAGARCDLSDDEGQNVLHYIGRYGDAQCCQLFIDFEISYLDIRTTDNYGWTPLHTLRWQIREAQKTEHMIIQSSLLTWQNVYEEDLGEAITSEEKVEAFGKLLRSIRDRVLILEIKELELVISKIQTQDFLSAREDLRRLAEGKVKAKIDHEAETFKAIELDIRGSRINLAIESIEEFIEVSRERMKVSPFDEEEDPWASSESGYSVPDGSSEDGERSVVELETDDDNNGDDEGWKTADEE